MNAEQETDALRVLVIEDNPDDLRVVRRLLQRDVKAPVQITECSRFADATDALDGSFDVCLLDYELGGYTALDLLRHMRADRLSGPVILLTGHDDADVDKAALDLGAADFLPKTGMTEGGLRRAMRYAKRQFDDQRRLRYMAKHDQLTGLLNRHTFLDELQAWLTSPLLNTGSVYLLYVDLDGFKAINDAWGHDVGDRALQHAADSLTRAVRKSDLVGRYGGDELIAAVGHVRDQSVADVLNKVLQQLRQPLQLDEQQIIVTASVGVARASEASKSADELVRLADHAMFAAKQAGRDTWSFYAADTPQLPRKRAAMEAELRNALADGGLHLQFESHVDCATGRIIGAEALARWNHPERGAIAPSEFVPLATESGLLRPFGQWSLDSSLQALAQWIGSLPDDFRLSVNIAPAQFLDTRFPDDLQQALESFGVPGQYLRLEITEDALLTERGNMRQRLNAVRDLGVSLALDDFGTGHSSLSQIAALPIDTLKIDTSFVTGMIDDPRSAALVRAILSLGDEMALTVIAEGVETPELAAALEQAGCTVCQGYLYPRGNEHTFLQALEQQARGS
ncbi:GGDEF domain-containing response regulator [bacterium]|nr:GGDEF domain-containing response regulator [bacterium]